MKKIRVSTILIIAVTCYIALVSCAPDEGTLFYGALELGEGRVIVSASIAASQLVTMYDTKGNFIKTLVDYTSTAGTPRGVAPYGSLGFLLSVDGTEEFVFYNLLTGIERSFSNTLITGNYFDVELGPDGNYYSIESNTIERFDVGGARFPIIGAAPAIATITGPCTLSVPTGLAVNSLNQLVAVNNTGNTLLRYTLSSVGASACATVALANNPRAVIAHSDGSLYVTTTNNAAETIVRTDQLGGSQVVAWAHTPGTIQDAFDLIELPNGNLLVASTGTDALVEITTGGTFIKTWARDANTVDVQGLLLIQGGE